MVKANAYGHGLVRIAKILQKNGVGAFGVASIDEAMTLKTGGINKPIFLMEGIFAKKELLDASKHEFNVIFHNKQQIKWLKEQKKLPKKIHAWLKIDTGMGRLGFSNKKRDWALKQLSSDEKIEQPVNIMSHFACSNKPTDEINIQQIEDFNNFIKDKPGKKSICNSSAIFNFPDMHYDYVRPGLALYGYLPPSSSEKNSIKLKPVMTFKTKLTEIHDVKPNGLFGYCPSINKTKNVKRIGIIAVGYGDGYPFALRKNRKTYVCINGTFCPVLGEVMMDTTTVDITNCPNAKVGMDVILWGDEWPIEKLVATSYSSVYSLLTDIHDSRVGFKWMD